MDWLITSILGIIVILIMYIKLLSNMNYWKKRGIPYVKPIPFFGNSLEIVMMRKNIIESICNYCKQFDGEKYVGTMQFSKPILIIRDPELVSQVLTKDFSHFHDRGSPLNIKREPLNGNLVNLTGNDWRQVRHKLTPTFTSGKLKMMFHQIEKCSEDAIKYLHNKKEGIEAKSYMQKFILNVIGLVAFGLKIDALNDESKESQTFVENCTKAFSPSKSTLIKIILLRIIPRLYNILKIRFMDIKLEEFFMKLVKDTINYRERTNIRQNDFIQLMLDLKEQENSKSLHQSNTVNENSLRHKNDDFDYDDMELLDQLKNSPIQHETPVFTDNCIAAQSFLFITGGSETTASTLSFCMLELAMNRKVQDRLQNEVDSILSSRKFDYQAVQEMVYMEQIIYEVLRMHPPLRVMFRNCTKDFVLPGTDKVIEKKSSIAIPISELHKNPEYFPEPDKFNPDRFEDMKAIPKGVFLPFGDGPRICIAKRLAMMEMKIYLAKLMSKYNLTLSEKTQLPIKMEPMAIFPLVVGGIWICFEDRD